MNINDEKNLAIICDINDKSPVGVICCCPITGDIAFSSKNEILEEVLDIILDNKAFLHSNETINNQNMINREEISKADGYYLMSINYSLPFPWRILGVTSVEGDIEKIVEDAILIFEKKEE